MYVCRSSSLFGWGVQMCMYNWMCCGGEETPVVMSLLVHSTLWLKEHSRSSGRFKLPTASLQLYLVGVVLVLVVVKVVVIVVVVVHSNHRQTHPVRPQCMTLFQPQHNNPVQQIQQGELLYLAKVNYDVDTGPCRMARLCKPTEAMEMRKEGEKEKEVQKSKPRFFLMKGQAWKQKTFLLLHFCSEQQS